MVIPFPLNKGYGEEPKLIDGGNHRDLFPEVEDGLLFPLGVAYPAFLQSRLESIGEIDQ
jgi:hypothetical protein